MKKLKSIRMWIHGLVAAAIGGAANTVTNMVVAPESFNLKDGLKNVLIAAGVSALLSSALYLKQSPLPDLDEDDAPPKFDGTAGEAVK